ncbi:hypothetical protein [Halogeometricum rufum]|nr:hypothetical protein [Halogeometricum rufum]
MSPRKRARLWAWVYTATVGGDEDGAAETAEASEAPAERTDRAPPEEE